MRCQSDLSSADLRWRRDVGYGGDASAFRNERGDEIETVQDQLADQQARDDRGNRPADESYTYADRRYRDDGSDRGRDVVPDDDARAPAYYVDDAPRFSVPRVQIFGPDD